MSLSSGSCWDILEIEPTDNKKLIKKAYHKLLRLYKPDEKPNEFKKLYEAYQEALEWEDYGWENIETTSDIEIEQESIDEWLENIYDLDNSEAEEEDLSENFYDDYWSRWAKFEEKVDELTYDNNYPELFNQLKNWKFIEELQLENDIELHQRAAEYLFNAIGSFDEKNETSLLNSEVINYLNNIFLWDKYWQNYDSDSTMFDYLTVTKVAPKKEKKTPYPLATIQSHLSSFLFDLGIALIVLLLLQYEPKNILLVYSALYTFHFGILGFRTPGQMAFKIETLEGDEATKPTKTARLIRVIFTFLNLYSIMLLIEEPLEMNPLVYLVGIINLLFWMSQKRFLQDWSATRVYDVSKD